MTGPLDAAVPPGMTVVLDRYARILDRGAVLIGGAPPRMLRLSPAARALVAPGRFTVTDRVSAALARRLLDAGIAHPVPAGAGPSAGGVTVVIPVRDRVSGLTRLLAALTAGPPDTAARPVPAAAGLHGHDAREGTRHPGVLRLRGAGSDTVVDGRSVWPTAGEPRAATGSEIVVDGGSAGTPRAATGSMIVVDDGSVDRNAVRAVAERFGARLLCHDISRGPAAARNTGLAAATTPLVAFLDSDVVPEPGWLAPLLAGFADPAVGLVAPRIVALPPVTGWLGRYEAVRSSLDLGPDPALIVPRSRVAYVPSAALLVRRDAVGAGFDEAMPVAEDVDLVLRLHAEGWRLRYEPGSRVAHEHRTTPRAWLARKAFYGTGAAPLALRHPGAVPPMVLSPWAAATGALLLLARWWSVPVAAIVSVLAADRLGRRLGRSGRASAAPAARPRAIAARLIALGAVGAVEQTADAVTRHYWPVAALAALVSRRARRTVATVAVAQGVLDWCRHRRRDARVRPDLVSYVLARRLDDLAYGTGLWWGAWRHRTLAPLRPAGPGRPSGTLRTDDSPSRV